jgi:hypothetical protein
MDELNPQLTNQVPPEATEPAHKKPLEAAEFNPESLTYKTMPKMKGLGGRLWRKGVPLTSVPSMKAPSDLPKAATIPVTKPALSESHPAAPVIPISQPNFQANPAVNTEPAHNPASLAAMGIASNPVKVPGHDSVLTAPLSSDFEMETRPKTKPWIKYAGISLIVILLAGGGYFAYGKFFGGATDDKGDEGNDVAVTDPVKQSEIDKAWIQKYFDTEECSKAEVCGDQADPDRDGYSNLEEFKKGTDPNNSDSDADRLADGDEVNIFNFNPLTANTSGNTKYNDLEDIKNQWNAAVGHKFSDEELKTVAVNVGKYGFHSPTTESLTPEQVLFYTNYGKTEEAPKPTEPQPGALDRDTQRSDTINRLGIALLSYKQSNKTFPNTNSFEDMIKAIKPLIISKAINTTDPTNKSPFVYAYEAVNGGQDFKLSYFSETQNKAVIINAGISQKASIQDQSIQRDTIRKSNIEQIATALELYANDNTDPLDPEQRLYPTNEAWRTAISPDYLTTLPKDPQTNKDYSYTAKDGGKSFELKTALELPPQGKSGYACIRDECDFY